MKKLLRFLFLMVFIILVTSRFSCSKQTSSQFSFSSHHLRVILNPRQHSITAIDTIRINYIKPTNKIYFFLNDSLAVESVSVGDQKLDVEKKSPADFFNLFGSNGTEEEDQFKNAQFYQVNLPNDLLPENIEIRYTGTIYDSLKSASFSRMMVADQTSGLIGENGIFLDGASFWYPLLPHELSNFRLTTLTPRGFRVLSSGKLLYHKESNDSLISCWEETKPLDTIYLCAGNYEIQSTQLGKINVSTFFFPQTSSLSSTYLQACTRYLKMYNDMFGEYLYDKFAVVENFFPTGYGMPSFTLLGSQIIRLPFITKISLGHEICHNWWGDGVFVDMEKGNWCEGLTVYSADYHYKELQSPEAAKSYRYEALKDYASYVNKSDLDFPLIAFRERTTPASRTIGYGKAMMVFHQLRKLVGDENFYKALRTFYQDYQSHFAGWNDIREVFEKTSQFKLHWFFDQWVDKPGAPVFSLQNPTSKKIGERYQLKFKVLQKAPHFRVNLPCRITTTKGVQDTILIVKRGRDLFQFSFDSKISKIELDPDYDVFRRLQWQEITPSLSQFFGAKKVKYILPSGGNDAMRRAYRKMAMRLSKSDSTNILIDNEFAKGDTASAIMIFASPAENKIVSQFAQKMPAAVSIGQNSVSLFEQKYGAKDICSVIIFRNPDHLKLPVVWIWGKSTDALAQISRKIPHYGKYGYLVFDNGRNILKGNWPVENSPLAVTFK